MLVADVLAKMLVEREVQFCFWNAGRSLRSL